MHPLSISVYPSNGLDREEDISGGKEKNPLGAHNVALISHRHQDMQAKTTIMASTAEQIGLEIIGKKTKHVRMNSSRKHPSSSAGKKYKMWNTSLIWDLKGAGKVV